MCLCSVAFAAGYGMPGAAQQVTLPEGCTAKVTVQIRSCEVQHYFTCAADPAGWQRTVSYTPDGMVYAGVIDAETQWIESLSIARGISESLMADPADPASLTELLAMGHDSFDFRTDSPQAGMMRFVGQDSLTGKTVVIDGVTLDQTEFSMIAYDAEGAEMWRSAGNEFISREWGRFLPGTSTIKTDEETYDTDDTPVDFAFPGEPGFLTVNPQYGCDAVMSRAPVHPKVKGDAS